VEGEVADVPVSGAWLPTGDGRRYFILSPRVLREAELVVGEVAEMRFAVSDQNAVDTPGVLSEALQRDPRAHAAWMALTPGKQRGLAYRIHGARTDGTRAKRLTEVLALLLE
jgi:uncharacterized protein YdeI (YjbR/CyaY-like superfamily)